MESRSTLSASIKAYPNPLVGSKQFYLSMKGMPAGVYSVSLIATNGRIVFTQSIKHGENNSVESVNLLHSFAAGAYLVKVSNGITDANCTLIIK